MKRLTIYIFLMLMLIGCTQNDGIITPMFGYWRLDRITVDGETVATPESVWAFQSSIVCFQMLKPIHEMEEHWALWDRMNGIMSVSFDNYDDSTPAGEWPYNPPRIPGFPKGVAILQLKEITVSKHDMILEHIASDGTCYIYYLSKLY